MTNHRLLTVTFIFVVAVGLLHQLGSIYALYWDIAWFDTMVHFVGGLSMGFLFLWVWNVSGFVGKSIPTRRISLISVFVFVAIVGIGWELFEYFFNIANPTKGNYIGDTTLDLFADLCGGIIAGFVGGSKKFYE
ncbi:MAG: hypothetical protein ACYCY6_00450 [Minisyncoccota bacterium]